MPERKPIESWLTDMDGVLIHEGIPIPGADEFIQRLRESGKPFLVLTNNSIYTPRDLHARLARMGLDVPGETSGPRRWPPRKFLDDQRPGGTAYVIGEAGLTTALHDVGYVLTDADPDYVVLGETRTYSFEAITKAIRLINAGAAVHRHQPRPDRPVRRGRAARHRLGRRADHQGHRRGAVLRRQAQPDDDARRAERHRGALREHRDDRRPDGHRRRLAGMEAGLETILVLTGLTTPDEVDRYPLPAVPGGRLHRRPDRPGRPRPRGGRLVLSRGRAAVPGRQSGAPATAASERDSSRRTASSPSVPPTWPSRSA